MKITPIPEELWRALSLLSNEVEDVLKHATENDFENHIDYINLRESADLVSEFISCYTAKGEVSQRGEVPQCWNENTIFTPHRELREEDSQQLEFDWGEKIDE